MKILVFIPAYNVENHLRKVVKRLPDSFLTNNIEILIIDDCSSDNTLKEILKIQSEINKIKINYISNKLNMGYGGTQKIAYNYAIKNNFDFVVMVHGDGQYAPEIVEKIILPLNNNYDAVQGSRMMFKSNALKGNMPFYKFIANIVLTKVQNLITNMNMSEYHSGYRSYKIDILKRIPFHLNSNYFQFDTEIFIQINIIKGKIKEVPIMTFYGKEISNLNGIKYGIGNFINISPIFIY